MSTSANPVFQKYSPLTQVTLHSSLKVAQAAGMIMPPVYIVATLARRRPLSINGIMKNAIASVVVGAGIGAGVGYARLVNQPEDKIVDRVNRLVSNMTVAWACLPPCHSVYSVYTQSADPLRRGTTSAKSAQTTTPPLALPSVPSSPRPSSSGAHRQSPSCWAVRPSVSEPACGPTLFRALPRVRTSTRSRWQVIFSESKLLTRSD